VERNHPSSGGGLPRLGALAQRARLLFGFGDSWNVSMCGAVRQRPRHAFQTRGPVALRSRRADQVQTGAPVSRAVMMASRRVSARFQRVVRTTCHTPRRLMCGCSRTLDRQLPHFGERRINNVARPC